MSPPPPTAGITLSGTDRPFVSSSRDSVRMFRRDWMEALSKVHFSVPLLVYVPLIVGLLFVAATRNGLRPLNVAAWFGLGLVIWTPTEYVLHRWVFHYRPPGAWGQRLHFIFHGVHHDYPNDARRLVMPPSASLPLALLFYGLFRLALPMNAVNAGFAGFLVGYLIYDMMHYALHHATFRANWLKTLKRHHMQHHFVDSTHGYGVSSPLWDVLLGSMRRSNPSDRATLH